MDRAGMPEEDFYLPPRYFCFRSDDTLLAAVGKHFEVLSFERFVPEPLIPTTTW